MGLLRIVIVLVVLGLVAWLVTFLPLPAPFPEIIRIVIIVVAVVLVIWELLAVVGWASSPLSKLGPPAPPG